MKIDPTEAATVVLPIRAGWVVVMDHSPVGVSLSCCNCVTMFTRTPYGDDGWEDGGKALAGWLAILAIVPWR
jgi:hypothetical protein